MLDGGTTCTTEEDWINAQSQLATASDSFDSFGWDTTASGNTSGLFPGFDNGDALNPLDLTTGSEAYQEPSGHHAGGLGTRS